MVAIAVAAMAVVAAVVCPSVVLSMMASSCCYCDVDSVVPMRMSIGQQL